MQKTKTNLSPKKRKNLIEVLTFENVSSIKSRDKIFALLEPDTLDKVVHFVLWLYGDTKGITINDLIEIRLIITGAKTLWTLETISL